MARDAAVAPSNDDLLGHGFCEMGPLTIVLVAIALAIDSFSVSISSGMAMTRNRLRGALTMSAFFGAFQAGMPVLGWLGGIGLHGFITTVDHWIAFGLLSTIGVKMVSQSIRGHPSDQQIDPTSLGTLLVLSVATSIDALTAGISFAFLQSPITIPVIVIGVVTFGLSLLGALAGHKCARYLDNRIDALGGIVLIGIGIRILVQHLAVT